VVSEGREEDEVEELLGVLKVIKAFKIRIHGLGRACRVLGGFLFKDDDPGAEGVFASQGVQALMAHTIIAGFVIGAILGIKIFDRVSSVAAEVALPSCIVTVVLE
jgi:hypothetical protein